MMRESLKNGEYISIYCAYDIYTIKASPQSDWKGSNMFISACWALNISLEIFSSAIEIPGALE